MSRERVEIEKRKPFRGADIARRFSEQQGRCALCPTLIQFAGGPPSVLGASLFIADHRVPRALGGKTTLSNLDLLCIACDDDKTDGRRGDIASIARAKRLERASDPAARKQTKRPLRSRGFRKDLTKKMSGAVVRRENPP